MDVTSAVNNSAADRKLRGVNIYVCIQAKSFEINLNNNTFVLCIHKCVLVVEG